VTLGETFSLEDLFRTALGWSNSDSGGAFKSNTIVGLGLNFRGAFRFLIFFCDFIMFSSSTAKTTLAMANFFRARGNKFADFFYYTREVFGAILAMPLAMK
jgi:hypothetical protein